MHNTTDTTPAEQTSTPAAYGRLVLLRHGQTVWSETAQYTGRTDIPLTEDGRAQAVSAGQRLREAFPEGFAPENIFVSYLQRARDTAHLAGFDTQNIVEEIAEWDYGRAEGRTRGQLEEAMGFPWDVWEDGPETLADSLGGTRTEIMPDGTEFTVVNGVGERLDEAAARARRAIDLALPALEKGEDVLFVAHAHILRILTTQWLQMDPLFGRKLRLDTAHYCVLGMYKGDRVIDCWNC